MTAQDIQFTNMPIDYSKWKDIEVSDDEDDTHPNIDTPSLFKWRHEARVQRMEELEQKKKDAENLKKKAVEDLKILKEKANSTDDSGELESIKKSIKEIEDMAKEAKQKTEEVEKEERLRPWNVDTISKAGFSKTTINKPVPRQDENISEEEREKRMKEFVQKNKQDMKRSDGCRSMTTARRSWLSGRTWRVRTPLTSSS